MDSRNKKDINNNNFIFFIIAFSRTCSGNWHSSIAGVNTSVTAGFEWSSDRDRL
jgi:hypothetical protein